MERVLRRAGWLSGRAGFRAAGVHLYPVIMVLFMEDLSTLIQYIRKYVELSAEEEALILTRLSIVHVRKKQTIHQPGYIARHRSYVLKGAMRAFIIGNDGQEHTISLAIEDWWIGDPSSFTL